MKKTTLLVALAAALALLAGCGGGGGDGKASEANYAASRSVTDALLAERKLDDSARSTLAAMSANTLPLAQGMDTLTAQTRTLLGLIEDVAAKPRASNKDLSKAQDQVESYLRERVFQLEAIIGAQSPQEAQATYDGGKPKLENARNDVRTLLFRYDPSLEKSVP